MKENFKYPVTINWNNQHTEWWNETCAMVLEVFGLPGNRFYYTPRTNDMVFSFKTENDQRLCQILLSDRI